MKTLLGGIACCSSESATTTASCPRIQQAMHGDHLITRAKWGLARCAAGWRPPAAKVAIARAPTLALAT